MRGCRGGQERVGGEDRKEPEGVFGEQDSFTVLSIAPNLYVQQLKQRFSSSGGIRIQTHLFKMQIPEFHPEARKYLSI